MIYLLWMKDFKTILKILLKVPNQSIFLTPLAQKFVFSGLWCTRAIICEIKNILDYDYNQFEKKIEQNPSIASKVMSNKVLFL